MTSSGTVPSKSFEPGVTDWCASIRVLLGFEEKHA